jgi:endonuclease I
MTSTRQTGNANRTTFALAVLATATAIASGFASVDAQSESDTSSAMDYTYSFDGCDVESYYSSLSADAMTWTREDVHSIIQSTHRNVLPYTRVNTPGVDDVWAALMDIDVGPVPDTVNLLYTNSYIDAIPFGQRGWVKENIFPADRGIGLDGPDLSDIHNIKPNDVLASTVRGDRFFGECGVLTPNPETCQQPAEGAADDTCLCETVFTPPANVKGDIARALLYMDLRYDGSDFPETRNLRLTDCPFQLEHDMAYLSQMLQWHSEDPPDEAEMLRNSKVCEHWQGNRNPFVDFPELAQALHYEPFELPRIGDRIIYEACEKIPTEPPRPPTNECDTVIQPGDVYIWMLNSNDPDSIGLYSLVSLPENMTLFLTDNPWNGTQFVEHGGNDGTLMVRTLRSSFDGFILASLLGISSHFFLL